MTTATLGTAAAGRWVHIQQARGSGYRCRLCNTNFETNGWQFYPNGSFTATASVCGECAEALTEEEE